MRKNTHFVVGKITYRGTYRKQGHGKHENCFRFSALRGLKFVEGLLL
jgi:hypothetical protein